MGKISVSWKIRPTRGDIDATRGRFDGRVIRTNQVGGNKETVSLIGWWRPLVLQSKPPRQPLFCTDCLAEVQEFKANESSPKVRALERDLNGLARFIPGQIGLHPEGDETVRNEKAR
jgi:hypothetical protein